MLYYIIIGDIMKHLKLLMFFLKNKLSLKGFFNYERNYVRDKFMWFVMLHITWLPLTWFAFNFIFEKYEVKYIRQTFLDLAYGRGGFKEYGKDERLIDMIEQII